MIHKPQQSTVQIEKLKPYQRNSRTHSAEQIKQLARSIEAFGFTNPVLIDENYMILAGHGRVMAAQQIGLEFIPCLQVTWFSQEEKRAYVIADNKLAMNADWDNDLLEQELESLLVDGFNLNLTGFSLHELNQILDPLDEGDQSGITEVQYKKLEFFLHPDQIAIIQGALNKAELEPDMHTGLNDSIQSNALALICKDFLNRY